MLVISASLRLCGEKKSQRNLVVGLSSGLIVHDGDDASQPSPTRARGAMSGPVTTNQGDLLTGQGSLETAVVALRYGAFAY